MTDTIRLDHQAVRRRTNSIGIKSQIAQGNARVHNGHVYNIVKRASTFGQTRTSILQWLSPLNFRPTHERIREQARIEKSNSVSIDGDSYAGKWLIESDQFDEWLSGRLKKLWCLGMPGAGKSVMASIIITHLLELQDKLKKTPDSGRVAYLYHNYKEPQMLQDLLGSVVKQLVAEDDPLPDSLVALWKYRPDNQGPTIKDLSQLLREIVRERRTFIIIDALDECQAESRLRLMELLQPDSNNLSILVTSRLLDEFDFVSRPFDKIEIRANSNDLDLFIDHEFSTDPKLQKYASMDRTLHGEVKRRVKKACNGMFLIASLQMQALAKEYTIGDVRQRLQNLPKKIDDMYELTVQRIEKLDPKPRQMALDTLAWSVASRRPLRIDELRHALSVTPGSANLDFDKIFLEDDIRDVCGGLITIKGGIVSLVHYTAQSYFKERFPSVHVMIVQTSIAYLSLKVLEQPDDPQMRMSHVEDDEPADDPLPYVYKLNNFPFVQYAARNLDYHLRNMSNTSSLQNIVLSLARVLEERPKRNFFVRVIHSDYYYFDQLDMETDDQASDTISYEESDQGDDLEFDLFDVGSSPMAQGERELCESESLWASIMNNPEFDSDSDTSSFLSASHGEEISSEDGLSSATSLCTTRETSPSSAAESRVPRTQIGETDPFSVPSVHFNDSDELGSRNCNDESGSKAPSETNINLSVENTEATDMANFVVTPMHLAAYMGWQPMLARVLAIPKFSDVNALDTANRTPLIIAVTRGHWQIVSTLLNHGASVDLVTETGHDILCYAAHKGEREIAQSIISTARRSQAVRTPLAGLLETFLTFLHRLLSILALLVGDKQSVQPQSVDATVSQWSGKPKSPPCPTQLRYHLDLLDAALAGDVKTIEKLVRKRKVNFRTERSRFHATALFIAVEFGHARAVEKMLELGADVNVRGVQQKSLLHVATDRNLVPIVEILLAHGADVDARDNEGESAYMANSDASHKEVMQLLRKAGANPNEQGPLGVTRLYEEAAGGHLENVRFLLAEGVNPSIQTEFGWAPLHWAAHNNHLDVVLELLRYKADPNPMSDQSTTPLDMARRAKRDLIAQILLDAGAKTAQELLAGKTSAIITIESNTASDESRGSDAGEKSDAPNEKQLSPDHWLYSLDDGDDAEDGGEYDEEIDKRLALWPALRDVVQRARVDAFVTPAERRRVKRYVRWRRRRAGPKGGESGVPEGGV